MSEAASGNQWTLNAIKKAVKGLKNGAYVEVALGAENEQVLAQLNEDLFRPRPDLILHIWSNRNTKTFTAGEVSAIAGMKYLKNLHLTGYANKDLAPFRALKQLESLKMSGNLVKLDFLASFKQLRRLFLIGKFSALDTIAFCHNLRELYLQDVPLKTLDFLKNLKKLEFLRLDSLSIDAGLNGLRGLGLKNLEICSVPKLEDVSFLATLLKLERLHLIASKVKNLPDLSPLKRLRQLELHLMKLWKNPEILATIPNLERLELEEINTALKAEQFFFLAEMKSLQAFRFEFMDFNKGRIQKLTTAMVAMGKKNIIEVG